MLPDKVKIKKPSSKPFNIENCMSESVKLCSSQENGMSVANQQSRLEPEVPPVQLNGQKQKKGKARMVRPEPVLSNLCRKPYQAPKSREFRFS